MTPKLLQGATFAAADSGRGTACCTGAAAIWIIRGPTLQRVGRVGADLSALARRAQAEGVTRHPGDSRRRIMIRPTGLIPTKTSGFQIVHLLESAHLSP